MSRYYTEDTRRYLTLKVAYPLGWDDFLNDSGIEDTPTHQLLFESLYYQFGDTFTIEETNDYLTSKLKFQIIAKGEKYDALKGVYSEASEKLLASIDEIKTYATGNRLEDGEEFDDYLVAKNISSSTDNLIEKYKEFQKLNGPLERIVLELKNYIFLPVVRDYSGKRF